MVTASVTSWSNLPDIFASAANFLVSAKWKKKQAWAQAVLLPRKFDKRLANLRVKKTLPHWQSLAVKQPHAGDLPKTDLMGSVVLPHKDLNKNLNKKQRRSEFYAYTAYIVHDNYRSLLRWNSSVSFAIAVGLLWDRISER